MRTHLDLLLHLELCLRDGDDYRWGEVARRGIGTHLSEALLSLPVEPLVLLADLDTARGHAGTHGWRRVGKKERKGWWERKREEGKASYAEKASEAGPTGRSSGRR